MHTGSIKIRKLMRKKCGIGYTEFKSKCGLKDAQLHSSMTNLKKSEHKHKESIDATPEPAQFLLDKMVARDSRSSTSSINVKLGSHVHEFFEGPTLHELCKKDAGDQILI